MITNESSSNHPTSILTTDLVSVVTNPSTGPQGQLITLSNFMLSMASSNNLRPATSKYLLGNLNNVWTRHFKEQLTTGRTTTNRTYGLITTAPCSSFTHVRMILKNGEATAPAVLGALMAVTASSANITVPTVGNTLTNDSSTGWVQAKFNGLNAPTLVGGTSTNPTILFSDWMPLNSITPTDTSCGPLIMGRIKMTDNYSQIFIGVDNSNPALDTFALGVGSIGDFITTPEGMTSTVTTQTGVPMFGFEFKSATPVIKVLCVGSSTTQGNGSTPTDSLYASWVPLANSLLRTAGVPANMINYGYNSQASATYAAFGKAAIAAHQPSIVFYPPFSTNDGTPTQAIIDTQYAQAIDFAQYAMSQNCLPVFTFLCPNNSYTLTQDNFRKSLIARCQASGFLVCDMTTAVGDGASPERFKPNCNFDGTHTNDIGYALQAVIAGATVTDILNRNISW